MLFTVHTAVYVVHDDDVHIVCTLALLYCCTVCGGEEEEEE